MILIIVESILSLPSATRPYFYLIKKQTRIIRGILNADNTDLTDKHG
ncbi:MAG: hypothetical protein LBB88_03665 [Planctomycetaceae bacterium]|nr:hypothetical protein [Planctomycetaceae bacterium]